MTKLDEVLFRLKRKYSAYEKERANEEGFIDISVACDLADSIPYLIKEIEGLVNENHKLFNQSAELVCAIYEHTNASAELMEIAEKIDND